MAVAYISGQVRSLPLQRGVYGLYRSNVCQHLQLTVLNLDQLNSTLHLLEQLHDMENKIDDI
jgi:hypothetical protein